MNSKIIIEDLRIYAYHGVLPEEKIIGTWYLVNLEITTDLWNAVESDALSSTLNYAEVNEIIHREMAIPSKLMEHVGGRILNTVYQNYPGITFLKIKITKTNPPMKGEMKGVSIELEKKITRNTSK
ncbi:dihydroneopterin aldolase [Chryseobacterium lacus]|uniref:7,8-dihydroneopterin aldolase n=1 Tax=Chryseobacterium lacus TaxID=2058346 RepID=A0A368N128_9FLAO|nr:dihydroneopterin aldolase [Chryseobacterium lacus]RCU43880.1 dihydroneopterin aldolase [Chryseobacterium lacus]RST28806.1 dihydroneopterin aldolase [Chryseobacterium lacus]